MEPTVPPRAPLPTDPWSVDAPGAAYDAALDAGLAALGLLLDDVARRAIEAHVRLLLAWTEAINLTAIRSPEGAARLHVIDSLTAAALLRRLAPVRPTLLDVGSGGGMPGLPLGIALGARRVALLDSIAKKVRFLSVAADAVRQVLEGAGDMPPSLDAVLGRAEDLARDPAHRGSWDVVTVRAVGQLGRIVELGLPLASPGGLLVCWKRDDGTGSLGAELRSAGPAIRRLGGGAPEVHHDPEQVLPGHRLVVIRRAWSG